MHDLERLIRTSNKVLILSGAGLSKSAGIPTYRDENGIWTKNDPTSVCDKNAHSNAVMGFFLEQYNIMSTCQPTVAHNACAELESLYNVLHVTQNVDGLLLKAGCKKLIEIHGSIHHWYCTVCKHDVIVHSACNNCGSSVIRPNVVLFGETPDSKDFNSTLSYMSDLDMLLIVGTGAEVLPIAQLPKLAKDMDIPIVAINVEKPNYYCNYFLQGKAEDVLPAIVDDIKQYRIQLEG